jgi:cytosine/uracil/thiamine/allantoin permease
MISKNIPKTKAQWKAAISTNSEHEESSQWINEDLAPTPPEARTWSWYALLVFLTLLLGRTSTDGLKTGYLSVPTGGV